MLITDDTFPITIPGLDNANCNNMHVYKKESIEFLISCKKYVKQNVNHIKSFNKGLFKKKKKKNGLFLFIKFKDCKSFWWLNNCFI